MNGKNGKLLDHEEVVSVLESIYKYLKITPKEIQLSSGSEKGDGFLSFIVRVDTITTTDKKFHVILKCAPRLEAVRKLAPIKHAFSREIYFYTSIAPTFEKFQQGRNVLNPFQALPKCYKTQLDENRELLVLENIKENGYQLWDRKQLMNEEHIVLVLRTYAKFHAISYAMQEQEPLQYAELIKDLFEIFSPNRFDADMTAMFNQLSEKVQNIFEGDLTNVALYEKLGKFKEEGLMAFWKSLDTKIGKFPVICHGDCWVNNMMFKYNLDNPKKPTDICLLDFQLCKSSSPVSDLSYFLYASAPKTVLDQLDMYLTIYHNSLKDALRAMGCQKEPITMDDLKTEWKEMCKFGFIMSMMTSRVMMQEPHEIFEFTDLQDGNMEELMNRPGKNDHLLKEKMKTLVLHLDENNFI